MASFKELTLDWSMLPEDTTTWDLEDLQLAAQLAKTFLKRNEELAEDISSLLKAVDEQQTELEYFKKQNTGLRAMSDDCHTRIFELEAQVEDLIKEKDEANVANKNKSKHNNELLENIQILNQRCVELEWNLDKATRERDELLKTSLRDQKEINEDMKTSLASKTSEFGEIVSFHESVEKYSPKVLSEDISLDEIKNVSSDISEQFMEELMELASVLQYEKSQRIRVEQQSADLEERLSTLLEENIHLKRLINAKCEVFKSKFNSQKMCLGEVNTLDEVRFEICSYCSKIIKGYKIKPFFQMVDENYNETSVESLEKTIEKETRRYTSSLLVLIGENGEIIGKQD